MNRLPALLFALTLVMAGCASTSPPSPTVPAAFHVDVGFEDTAQGLEAEAFFPPSLVVNVGDSVVFTMRSHEAHTISFNSPKPLPEPLLFQPDHVVAANPVVFLPPGSGALTASFDGKGFVSSGVLRKPGDSFTVSFEAPGTFQALCLLHASAMKATIIVNTRGTPRPLADSDYRVAAEAQVTEVRSKAAELLAGVVVPGPVNNADGSRTWMVYAGVGNAADGIDYMRFIGGEKLSIRAGDSVTFDMKKNTTGTPHTVTFLAGTDRADPFVQQPREGGPPSLVVNPRVLLPAPDPPGPYDGAGYCNSGLVLAGLPITPQELTVTFTKPGTFTYLCAFHADEGMKGTIIVQQ